MSIIALVKLSRNIKQVWVFIFSDQDLTFVFFEISITSSAWKWKCQSTLAASRFNSVFFLNVKPKIGVKTIFCHISVFFFTEQNRFSLPHFTTFLGFCTPIFIFHACIYNFFTGKNQAFHAHDSGNFLVWFFFESSLSFFKLDWRKNALAG